MRRVVLGASLLLACDRHEAPEREAKRGGAKFDAAEQAELPPSPPGDAAIATATPEPPPITASPSGSADAVLAIFAGETQAERLPLVDVDPGHAFDPYLRDAVAPRVVVTGSGGPVVRMGMPTVTGGLDRDIVRRVVRRHVNEVRHCYDQTLVVAGDLGGDFEVTFAITPTGATDEVASRSTTLSGALGKRVLDCTSKAVERWKFPEPSDGKPVEVTHPFTLAPK